MGEALGEDGGRALGAGAEIRPRAELGRGVLAVSVLLEASKICGSFENEWNRAEGGERGSRAGKQADDRGGRAETDAPREVGSLIHQPGDLLLLPPAAWPLETEIDSEPADITLSSQT